MIQTGNVPVSCLPIAPATKQQKRKLNNTPFLALETIVIGSNEFQANCFGF